MSLLSPPLQAFVAIVKCKTVHGAAEAIHLTQTAVTQRIRALETRLRTTLFVRTRRGMMLTPEGEALLHYCQAAHEIEGEALAHIKGAGIESEVRVCVTGPTSIMRSRIIPQCFAVMKKFPNLLMHFDINDVASGVSGLRNGASQFAIVQPEVVAPEMACKILKPERYMLVGPAAWKKRKLSDIIKTERIVDYDPTDQMTFRYLKHFHLLEYVRHDRHFANRTESLAEMLIAGFGYGLLTMEFSKSYVNSGELILLNAGKIYENAIALAWFARSEPPKYFAALVQAIV